MAEPSDILNGQVDYELVLVVSFARHDVAEDVLAIVAADDQAEDDISALAGRLHLCVAQRQLRPVLKAFLCHVEVIQADDWKFVNTSGVRPTLFTQSAAFDTLFAPAPIGPVCDAVELNIGNARLFR